MKAAELKEEYPLFPEVTTIADSDGFTSKTLVRKKCSGQYYLFPVKNKNTSEDASITGVANAARLTIKYAVPATSESYVAVEGIYVTPLDDNQND